MQEYENILKEIGLSEKEAKVYIALLSLGPSTVNTISEASDLIRTTTYDILKSMREKGLVSSMIRNRILNFEAADPQKIVEDLDMKKQKMIETIPSLRKIKQRVSQSPVIELYDGKEGIRTVWQDILKEGKHFSAVSNHNSLFNTLKYLSPRFIKQRIDKGIHARLLTEKTPDSIDTWKKNDKKELRETRFIPSLEKTQITEYIYGSKVAILSTEIQNPLAIIIRHKDFVDQQLALFDFLWKNSDK